MVRIENTLSTSLLSSQQTVTRGVATLLDAIVAGGAEPLADIDAAIM
jgi:hypothetical protein